MTPRRRASDASRKWWQARVSFIAALVLSPAVFVAAARFIENTIERVVGVEHEISALQKRVDGIDLELFHLRKHGP